MLQAQARYPAVALLLVFGVHEKPKVVGVEAADGLSKDRVGQRQTSGEAVVGHRYTFRAQCDESCRRDGREPALSNTPHGFLPRLVSFFPETILYGGFFPGIQPACLGDVH